MENLRIMNLKVTDAKEYFKAHFQAAASENSAIERTMDTFVDCIDLTNIDDNDEMRETFAEAHAEWLAEYVEDELYSAEIGETLFIEVFESGDMHDCTGVRIVNLGNGDCVYRYETDSHDNEWEQGDYESAASEAWVQYEESLAAGKEMEAYKAAMEKFYLMQAEVEREEMHEAYRRELEAQDVAEGF